MIKYLLFMGCLMSTCCCKTPHLSPHSYDKEQISFGSGGGFAGTYTEHFLLSNGKMLMLNKENKKFVELKQIENKVTKQIFSNIKAFGLDTMDYVHPQNMYYFLKYKNGRDSNYVSWSGKPDAKIAAAASIYNLLNAQLKKIDK